jgi:hypothetical protein
MRRSAELSGEYPTREFLSFAEAAARNYIDLTRYDQFIYRDVANAINGLTEFLRLERKRVPGGPAGVLILRRVRSALRRRRASRPVAREDRSPQLRLLVHSAFFVLNSDAIAHKWFCQKTNRLLRPITPHRRPSRLLLFRSAIELQEDPDFGQGLFCAFRKLDIDCRETALCVLGLALMRLRRRSLRYCAYTSK